MGTELRLWAMQRGPELDGGDGCTTLWTCLMPLNAKMGSMVAFMLCVFCHN